MQPITVTVDAMSGDHGLKVSVPAVLDRLAQHENLHVILVGDEALIQQALKKKRIKSHPRLKIHHATQVVEMDEHPAQALRSKKDSSMRVAIDLVKSGQSQACVSAGNTGALMMTARFVLKTLPGVDRPAIIGSVPTISGLTYMLDLGANVDSTPEHLFQFAVMGSVLVSALHGIKRPSVGLLNIGTEDIKGNDVVKQSAAHFSQSNLLNYVGYTEAHDLFKGQVNVVVCDGFVGNIALKASEGLMQLLVSCIKKSFSKSIVRRIVALFARNTLLEVKQNIDPDENNGATIIGLQGIVIKSHGRADVKAFSHAIYKAMAEAEHNITEQTQVLLKQMFSSHQAEGEEQ